MEHYRLPEKYIDVAKRYTEKFNMSIEGYENIDYDEFTDDEIVALAERSIEQGTEIPRTIYNIVGDPIFIED